jgi:polyhydroxyalkanoate synthase
MNFDAKQAEAARQMQETFAAGLQQAMGVMANAGSQVPASQREAFNLGQAQPALQFDPAKLQELQQRYIADASALWNQGLQDGADTLVSSDRRFSGDAWKSNPVSKFSASAYLLNARTLMDMAEAVQADAKTRARVRFRGRAMDGGHGP